MVSRDLLVLPYQVARTPFAILETTLVQRLDEKSPLRRTFCRGFGVFDLAAGRLFHDDTLIRQGSERLGPPARTPERAPEPTPPVVETAAETVAETDAEPPQKPTGKPAPKPRPRAQTQRAAAAKRLQHDAARPNKNLATIAQDLARAEAIVEARDEQDSEPS